MRPVSRRMRNRFGAALAAGALGAALLVSDGAEGQPPAQQIQKPAQAAIAAPKQPLSPELQQLLKAGKVREAQALLRTRTPGGGGGTPAGPGAIAANPKGPQAYICNTGNCACAGASDCVTMIADKTCKEGTVGCNDSGCTCQAN